MIDPQTFVLISHIPSVVLSSCHLKDWCLDSHLSVFTNKIRPPGKLPGQVVLGKDPQHLCYCKQVWISHTISSPCFPAWCMVVINNNHLHGCLASLSWGGPGWGAIQMAAGEKAMDHEGFMAQCWHLHQSHPEPTTHCGSRWGHFFTVRRKGKHNVSHFYIKWPIVMTTTSMLGITHIYNTKLYVLIAF